jgi:hypothetical protein
MYSYFGAYRGLDSGKHRFNFKDDFSKQPQEITSLGMINYKKNQLLQNSIASTRSSTKLVLVDMLKALQ